MRTITCLLLLSTGCYQGVSFDEGGDSSGTTYVDGDGSGDGSSTALGDESTVCQPGEYRECYAGPPETRDVGACAAGQQQCWSDGAGFDRCTGMVLPSAERCDTPEDDNCDGSAACGGLVHTFVHSGARLHDVVSGPDRVMLAWSDADGVYLTGLSMIGAAERTVGLGNGLSIDDKILLAHHADSGDITLGATLVGTFPPGYKRATDCSVTAGEGDILLARFDADLEFQTSRCWGDAADQRLTALDIPADERPRIAGVFHGNLRFGDSKLDAPDANSLFFAQLTADLAGADWSDHFNAKSTAVELPSIAANGDGAVGFGTLRDGPGSFGGSDVFVSSYRSDGELRWMQRFGNAMDQVSRDVAVAADGSVWIVGDSQGLVAFEAGASADESTFLTFAARLDAAGGEPRVSRQIAGLGSNATRGRALVVDPAGDATLIGTASGDLPLDDLPAPSGSSDDDVVIIKLGAAGSVRWAKRLGDDGDQVARAIHLGPAANIVVGGEFSGVLAEDSVSVQSDIRQMFALQFMP